MDLFEVSATTTPMNQDTRVLDMKSADALAGIDWPIVPPDAEIRRRAAELAADPPSLEELKAKFKALGVDEILAKSKPIQIASFEC